MQDEINTFAPAKLNLFLRIVGKREDNFHEIRSGITFLNLFDEICIKKSNNLIIKYEGPFKPKKGFYEDCIIIKTLKLLNLYNKIFFNITIKKNIPVQAGLGAASTNAASFIQVLQKLDIIDSKIDKEIYYKIGADVPVFLFGKNALVEGLGEKITPINFPKYYFLIVKPSFNLSTKNMYSKLNKNYFKNPNFSIPYPEINDYDNGNDFEIIARQENNEIINILEFLSNTNQCIFSRMTGSGSCCYAAYENFELAKQGQIKFQNYYPDLWSFSGENNHKNK